jgi:hypothetical protein
MALLGAGIWLGAGGVFYVLLWSRLRQKARRRIAPPEVGQNELATEGKPEPLLAYPAG